MPFRPDWDALLFKAAVQSGLFTVRQAAREGISRQLLRYQVTARRIYPVRRGIFRVAHASPTDRDALVLAFLGLHGEGVFSHRTALALHGLAPMPSVVDLTVPDGRWVRRRRAPKMVLHVDTVPATDRTRVPPCLIATSPVRTLVDCWHSGLGREHLAGARLQAMRLGLVDRRDLARALAEAAARFRSPWA